MSVLFVSVLEEGYAIRKKDDQSAICGVSGGMGNNTVSVDKKSPHAVCGKSA